MKTSKFFVVATLFATLSFVFLSCEDKKHQNEFGTENGYEYVDLGLPSGLKWATCNVGATQPEESGDYFAWGETSPKSVYDWTTYKWCNGVTDSLKLTKYCIEIEGISANFGTIDNKNVLDPEDDAATVNMGGKWRMPTKAEQDELRELCMWEWQESKKGYKVIGPNGNSIFFPIVGYRDNDELFDFPIRLYWSSSVNYAYRAYFFDFFINNIDWVFSYRCIGLPVRGVCE